MTMLSDEAFLRYQRQVSLPQWGEQGQAKLANAHVLLIGCGGLGSAASLYLASAGVGKLVLVDDDRVELSNLQRQVIYRNDDQGQSKALAAKSQLEHLNPLIRIRAIDQRLDDTQLALEIMLADIVLDCTDNLETRQQINRLCFKNRTPLISASAIGWQGQFALFDYQQDSPCYHCLYPFDSLPSGQKCSELGVVGPVVGTLGNYQALAAIQWLALDEPQLSPSTLHLFDGLTMRWQTLTISVDATCHVCQSNTVKE